MNLRRWFGLIGLTLLAVMGCTGGEFIDITPPYIENINVIPTELRYRGGDVKVSAQVIDDYSGVAEVWAEVLKPSVPTKEKVMMSLVGENYQGTITAAPNIRKDGQAEIYQVWIRAKDAKGNETPAPGVPTDGMSFSVQAPLEPQDPPLF